MALKEADLPPWKQGQKIEMVIAHWCLVAPTRSGMYETVKELCLEEMKMDGVLAGIVDPDDAKGGKDDGYVVSQSHNWAMENATVHMSHYFMKGYACWQKPRVMAIHGTPEACWQAEKESGSFTASVQGVQDYDAAICMAKRHYHFWKEFDHKGVLHLVDKGIDLERFSPKGMRIDCDGEPSIGMGEVMRDAVKSPLIPYWAVNEFHRQNHNVRLHHWGIDKERELLEMMIHKAGFDRFLGQRGGLHGRQLFPEQWYRGCKMLVSPSMFGEPSRVQFEAQATGCPVVTWGSDPYGDSFANMFARPFDVSDMTECLAKLYDQIRANPQKVRTETRMIAQQHFDMKRMAKQVVEILRKVQEEN